MSLHDCQNVYYSKQSLIGENKYKTMNSCNVYECKQMSYLVAVVNKCCAQWLPCF